MPRVLLLAPGLQRDQGAEISHQRGVTSLVVLEMVYLFTETPNEMENEVVELVIFKTIHLLYQGRFFELDPGWQLFWL